VIKPVLIGAVEELQANLFLRVEGVVGGERLEEGPGDAVPRGLGVLGGVWPLEVGGLVNDLEDEEAVGLGAGEVGEGLVEYEDLLPLWSCAPVGFEVVGACGEWRHVVGFFVLFLVVHEYISVP